MRTSPFPYLTHVGGPTVIFEWAGLRVVSDPTFDPPGDYPIGSRTLTKTGPPAVGADQLGSIDLVLLSHDQHPDNLDRLGRAVLDRAALAISTPAAAARIPHITGLDPWDTLEVAGPTGVTATITAVPARHGPADTEHLTGPVTGFHLVAPGHPTVYLSGDNAALEIVTSIVDRLGPVDVAILHLGCARTALLGDSDLTLNAANGARAAAILTPAAIIAVHSDSWSHFTETPADIQSAFRRAGLEDRLVDLAMVDSAAVRPDLAAQPETGR